MCQNVLHSCIYAAAGLTSEFLNPLNASWDEIDNCIREDDGYNALSVFCVDARVGLYLLDGPCEPI